MMHLDDETVSAYVDGEGEGDEVRAHVAECHECALRVIAATRLKQRVGRMRVAMPAGAMERLTAGVQGQAQPRRSFGYGWMAVAAALILAAAMGGSWWSSQRAGSGLAAELLDEHLGTLSVGAQPEVVSTDRHTVKPWFQGKLPFSFNLPEALPADTALIGGDLAYVEGQPAALLLFTVHKHKVTVLVMQRHGLVALPRMRAGFNLRSAAAGELEVFAVSDVNAGEMEGLMEAVVKVQQ